jgi:hypothetical protein
VLTKYIVDGSFDVAESVKLIPLLRENGVLISVLYVNSNSTRVFFQTYP